MAHLVCVNQNNLKYKKINTFKPQKLRPLKLTYLLGHVQVLLAVVYLPCLDFCG